MDSTGLLKVVEFRTNFLTELLKTVVRPLRDRGSSTFGRVQPRLIVQIRQVHYDGVVTDFVFRKDFAVGSVTVMFVVLDVWLAHLTVLYALLV